MKKRVALIGNMNNNNFCLLRYLLDNGIDAHLFLMDEFEHFMPEHDSYNGEGYKQHITQLDWFLTGHWKIPKEKIIKDMEGYNFFIVTDKGVSYLQKANIVVDVFFPHGGDIFFLPFYKFKSVIPKRWEIGAWYQSYHQKKGIQSSNHIVLDNTNPNFENKFKKLGYKKNRLNYTLPVIYINDFKGDAYDSFKIENVHVKRAVEIRSKYDLVVLHNCRQVWTREDYGIHYKANDLLYKAFAKYIKSNPSIKACIITFEYGYDVAESKELIKKLNIEDSVFWFPLLGRKNIVPIMESCDIVAGEFKHSWIIGGVISESMVASKPLLGKRTDSEYTNYETLYPMLNAENEEEILNMLNKYGNDKKELVRIGKMANEWFLQNFINKPIEELLKIIRS